MVAVEATRVARWCSTGMAKGRVFIVVGLRKPRRDWLELASLSFPSDDPLYGSFTFFSPLQSGDWTADVLCGV